MAYLRRFLVAEDAAVTIDWVALSAGVVLLVLGIPLLFDNDLQAIVGAISNALDAVVQ